MKLHYILTSVSKDTFSILFFIHCWIILFFLLLGPFNVQKYFAGCNRNAVFVFLILYKKIPVFLCLSYFSKSVSLCLVISYFIYFNSFALLLQHRALFFLKINYIFLLVFWCVLF